MKRHPVLVPTSFGAIEGIVHEPDRDPLGSLVALNAVSGRVGPNRVWARAGDALCGLGLTVFRFDYVVPGPQRDAAHEAHDDAVIAESVAWFLRETGSGEPYMCGRCYGARRALVYAASHPVSALGLVAPALHARDLRLTLLRRAAMTPVVGRAVRPLLRASRKRAADGEVKLDGLVRDGLEAVGSSPSPWIVAGELDPSLRGLWADGPRPPALAHAEIEVVPGIALLTNKTPEMQRVLIERLTAWARRTISERAPA